MGSGSQAPALPQDICVRQTHDVTGLESGTKILRVAAINSYGQGPWSQVVSASVK